MTAVVDWYPRYLRRGYRKEIFTAVVCAVWFLLGLSMVTEVCFTSGCFVVKKLAVYHDCFD